MATKKTPAKKKKLRVYQRRARLRYVHNASYKILTGKTRAQIESQATAILAERDAHNCGDDTGVDVRFVGGIYRSGAVYMQAAIINRWHTEPRPTRKRATKKGTGKK